ncbi:hypothetical protein ACN4EK_24390 [Pantanalinema rosaneae CENA516]
MIQIPSTEAAKSFTAIARTISSDRGSSTQVLINQAHTAIRL